LQQDTADIRKAERHLPPRVLNRRTDFQVQFICPQDRVLAG